MYILSVFSSHSKLFYTLKKPGIPFLSTIFKHFLPIWSFYHFDFGLTCTHFGLLPTVEGGRRLRGIRWISIVSLTNESSCVVHGSNGLVDFGYSTDLTDLKKADDYLHFQSSYPR